MATKMTVVTGSGKEVVFNSDAWRREGNLLVIDYMDKKDGNGKPLLYGLFEKWDGFKVEYDA